MLNAFFNTIYSLLNSLKQSFLKFIKECAAAILEAKANKEKAMSEQLGEHVGCAICELSSDLIKRAVKIFISSLLAYMTAGIFGRFLPVHAGWHRMS